MKDYDWLVKVVIFFVIVILFLQLINLPGTPYNQIDNKPRLYLLSWKKVTDNAIRLYEKVKDVFDVWVINCDENVSPAILKDREIHLDDSAFYGTQFNTMMNHTRTLERQITGCLVGDIDPDKFDPETIKNNLNFQILHRGVGIYAPNDVRSYQPYPLKFIMNNREINLDTDRDIHKTVYTDCTMWFFHPDLIEKVKDVDFSKSHYGWGIDVFMIKLAILNGFDVVRDKTTNIYNPAGTNYNTDKANEQWKLFSNYLESIGHRIPITDGFNLTLKPQIHFVSNEFKKEAEKTGVFSSINVFSKVDKIDRCKQMLERTNPNDIILCVDGDNSILNDDIYRYCEIAMEEDIVLTSFPGTFLYKNNKFMENFVKEWESGTLSFIELCNKHTKKHY